jgi:hypothetical protein
MADTFANQIEVEVDGTPLDESLELRLDEVVVDDYLHLPDMFTLTFRDPDEPSQRREDQDRVARASRAPSGGTSPGAHPR